MSRRDRSPIVVFMLSLGIGAMAMMFLQADLQGQVARNVTVTVNGPTPNTFIPKKKFDLKIHVAGGIPSRKAELMLFIDKIAGLGPLPAGCKEYKNTAQHTVLCSPITQAKEFVFSVDPQNVALGTDLTVQAKGRFIDSTWITPSPNPWKYKISNETGTMEPPMPTLRSLPAYRNSSVSGESNVAITLDGPPPNASIPKGKFAVKITIGRVTPSRKAELYFSMNKLLTFDALPAGCNEYAAANWNDRVVICTELRESKQFTFTVNPEKVAPWTKVEFNAIGRYMDLATWAAPSPNPWLYKLTGEQTQR